MMGEDECEGEGKSEDERVMVLTLIVTPRCRSCAKTCVRARKCVCVCVCARTFVCMGLRVSIFICVFPCIAQHMLSAIPVTHTHTH